MVKRLFIPLLLATISLVIAVPVLAAYYVDIDVTESNGTDYDMLPVLVTMDIDYLAEHGFISENGLDVRVKNSQGSNVPFMLAEDRAVFASDITGDMVSRFQLTTDNDPLDSFAVCTGDGGYVTITAHANLELDDDFEIEFEGFVDTSVSAGTNYPDYVSTTESWDVIQVTDHTVTLPGTIIVGDLLVLAFGWEVGGVADTITWPNGWTELFQDTTGTEGAGLAYRRADGTEGASVTVTTTTNSISAHHVLRIQNYQGTPEAAYASGEDVNPNPPSLTPSWGSEQTLWIAGFGGGQLGAADVAVTGYPANYINTDNIRANEAATNNYAFAASCTRELTAASEDPGTFTMSKGVHWWAWTLGVQGDIDGGFVDKVGAFHIYSTGSNDIRAKLSGVTEITVTAAGFPPGKYIVNVWANGTLFGIDIDGDPEASTGVVSMINNGSNWKVLMPYFDYYTHKVGVNDRISYEPDSIIRGRTYSTGTVTVTNDDATVEGAGTTWMSSMEGSLFVSTDTVQYIVDSVTDSDTLELSTTYGGATLGGQDYDLYAKLPNEETADTYDGRITWGSNPEGISISTSGLSTEEAYYIEDIDPDTWDIISPEPAGLISGVDLERLESNPFHPLVEAIVSGSDGKLTMSLVWIGGAWFLFIAALIGVFIGSKQNLVFTSSTGLGFSILFYVMGIFDYWVIIIFAFGALAAVIHERMPTW